MNTSNIHILTALIPLLITGMALLLMAFGTYRKQNNRIKSGLFLLILNGILTTFTSAMGGASVTPVKSVPGIDEIWVSAHAWTGMATFLLSLYIAVLSLVSIRKSNFTQKRLNSAFLSVLIFLLLFILTSFLAFRIRG